MSLSLSRLIGALQLGATASTLYTCPNGQSVCVQHAVLTNTTGSSVTATIYAVPAGSSADATTTLLDAYSIGADTAYVSPELAGIVLEAGDSIRGLASTASAISVFMSGIVES